jgi:hypothetical protein
MANTQKAETVKIIAVAILAAGTLTLAYFGIIKPILNTIGITDDKYDREDKENADKLEGEAAFGSQLAAQYPSKVSMSDTKAQQLALQVYLAKGYIYDNEASAIAAIRDCQTTYNLSKLAFVFNRTYDLDLLAFLKTFMNDAQLSDVYQAVKNFSK